MLLNRLIAHVSCRNQREGSEQVGIHEVQDSPIRELAEIGATAPYAAQWSHIGYNLVRLSQFRSQEMPAKHLVELTGYLPEMPEHHLSKPTSSLSAMYEMPGSLAATSRQTSMASLAALADLADQKRGSSQEDYTELDDTTCISHHRVSAGSLEHPSELQLVKWLRDFFCVAKTKWESRLQLMPDLFSVSCQWDARGFFETGIKTLQQWYRGIMPTCIDDAVALMHLAWACAFTLHSDDKSYCWATLFQDMLDWQYILPNLEQRFLFGRLIRKWACDQGFFMAPSNLACSIEGASCSVDLQSLGEGRVLQECSMFLKGDLISYLIYKRRLTSYLDFIYARIREGNRPLPSSYLNGCETDHIPRMTDMLELITQPLSDDHNAADLRDGILFAEDQLGAKRLYNPWDVEVMLCAVGRVCSTNACFG